MPFDFITYAAATEAAKNAGDMRKSVYDTDKDGIVNAAKSCTGNAATATKLSAAKNITVGSKTNVFDGSANISFTLGDIGAVEIPDFVPIMDSNISFGVYNNVEFLFTGLGSLDLWNEPRQEITSCHGFVIFSGNSTPNVSLNEFAGVYGTDPNLARLDDTWEFYVRPGGSGNIIIWNFIGNPDGMAPFQ